MQWGKGCVLVDLTTLKDGKTERQNSWLFQTLILDDSDENIHWYTTRSFLWFRLLFLSMPKKKNVPSRMTPNITKRVTQHASNATRNKISLQQGVKLHVLPQNKARATSRCWPGWKHTLPETQWRVQKKKRKLNTSAITQILEPLKKESSDRSHHRYCYHQDSVAEVPFSR